jgi:transcriptional regulator GlxA family with amidase domain
MGAERAAIAELGVLIYPGAQMAAVHGLTDLFAVANRIAADHQAAQLPLLRISHWQVEGDQPPTRVYNSLAGDDGALLAVLIPPSIGGFSAAQAPASLMQWLRDQHANGATLGGVCVGSLMLAESGLLDGRSATTHWTSAKTFAERYPKIKLKADTPIVDDGDLITTAGLGKAREMLEFTNGTIDHIAWTVGYQDPGAFRAIFKKITGLAPSDYRARFGVTPNPKSTNI